MKKRNFALGLAFALAAAFAPSAAVADGGDIYDIIPLWGSTTPENAIKSGGDFGFVIRLLDRDFAEPTPSQWSMQHIGAGSEIYDDVYNPLRIGIVVSGRLRYANIDQIVSTNTACTDIYCSYRVQPGDFALPALLALEGSTPASPVIAGSGVDGAYYLQNSSLWALQDAGGDTAVFRWCSAATVNQAKSLYVELNREARVGDETLATGSFYVKTIDFDDKSESKDDVAYWRVVNQGSSSTQTYKPQIVADASPESSITLYVWSDDESAVKVNGTKRTMTLEDGSTGERFVYSFDLVTGKTEYDFAFTGQQQGRTANLVLSPTLGYVTDAAGHLVTNFLTRTVYCDAPLAPSINATLDPAYPTSAKNRTVDTSTNTTENLALDAIPLHVILSEPYGENLDISLRLRLEADPSVDVITNLNVGVSRQNDSFSSSDLSYTNFTIRAGQTQATVYVYPLGGTAATQSQGITFTPVISNATAAAHYESGTPVTLKIRNTHTPVIVEPEAGSDFGEQEAGGFQVPVVVSDCYRDLNHPGGFKVSATFSDGSAMAATNIVFSEDAESLVFLKGYGANATYATIRVTEPDGTRYATVRIGFSVKPEKTITASLYDSTSQADANTRTDYNEGETPLLRFTLSEALPVGQTLYAYLVPQSPDASNLVACAAFSNGVEIVGGQAQSSLSLANCLALLDGCSATETRALQFKVVTALTPTSLVHSVDTTYSPAAPLVINVRNVYPATEALYVNGDPRKVPNGGHFASTLSADVTNKFVASATDASGVDVTNGIMVVWCFSEGRSASRFNYSVVTSTTETVTCPHVFTSPGVTQTVQFAAIDKDMLASLNGTKPLKGSDLQELWPRITKLVAPYSATVFVGQAPHITITPEIDTIYENAKTGNLSIELSEAPEEDIKIAIAVQSMADDKPGVLEFQTYELTVKANQTTPAAPNKTLKYKYSALDGTPGSADQGFYVTATVLHPDYTNYFTRGECEVYVVNQPPVISPRQPENAYTNTTIAVGEEFQIEWSATDVVNDLTNGLTAKWYVNDILKQTVVVTNAATTNTTIVLTEEGLNEVKLVVTDKDGEDYNGRSERTWLYLIAMTKHLDVTPCGPASGTITKYGPMAGRGRVWADGMRSTVSSFAQTWYYNVKSANATVFAYGYPAATNSIGYKDDGKLGEVYEGGAYRDVAITPYGNGVSTPTATTEYYTYNSGYDNYFYRWAYIDYGGGSSGGGSSGGGSSGGGSSGGGSSGGGTVPSLEYGNPRPSLSAGAGVRDVVSLDKYEANKESYETRVVEAVFSREYLPSDNMGDINQDGIPDVYVSLYTGFGVVDANGEVTGDDLNDLSSFNDDEDYLPTAYSSLYAELIPGSPSGWVDTGRKFDAYTEIRGFCSSLNNAPALAGLSSALPDVSTNTLKDAVYGDLEYDAWLLAGAPTLADGVTPDMERWSPERPTDPTKPDTDGDEMTDGYEYYIWYRARVGYMENGVHMFLSGRRYNPAEPGSPDYISPETIASLYDPVVKNSLAAEKDTDNDGLTDLLEFETGTNPFDFDTDGDGLPDGYETLVLGTDPLKYATDDVTADGALNADGDAMATRTVQMNVVGFAGDDGSVKWICSSDAIPVIEKPATGTTFTCTLMVDGAYSTVECLTSADVLTALRDDGTLVLRKELGPESTWSTVKDGGKTYRKGALRIPAGSAVSAVAADVEYVAETVTNVPAACWTAWVYGKGGRLARGRERLHSKEEFDGASVVAHSAKRSVELMHWQVYQETGFDPRTAWKTTPDGYETSRHVNTRNFTALDEFLVSAFFVQEGTLDASVLVPTAQTPWQTLWRKYSTSSLAADSDLDGMPDGWELYLMAGPKKYNKDTKDRIVDYGYASSYSPLFDFGDVEELAARDGETETGLDGDPGDGLDWLHEFSGIESSAEYAETTPTITCLNPEWRNKIWPTDPWNWDTDGDGLSDGDEGGYFIYGASGKAGGGLNPDSWDTDKDGLPDPWEVEFRGTWSAGSSGGSNSVDSVAWNDDGMDGTVSDARKDYDNDGLCNWQEYMAGSMRCWRYDDTVSGWGFHEFDSAMAGSAWDAYWYMILVDEQGTGYNPHLVNGLFDPGTYFSRCTNEWDGSEVKVNSVYNKYYMFRDGVYHDLRKPPEKYKLGDTQLNKYTYKAALASWPLLGPPFKVDAGIFPRKYITCDPRKADTDNDGMDDYYELFHGMNPLLGSSGVRLTGGMDTPYDVVHDAYASDLNWSAENNYWLNELRCQTTFRVKDADKSKYDFETFPWLNGLANADPDGDGVRNQQEAIMPMMQAASTWTHTDPTPLWMTDTSYDGSLVLRYYRKYPIGAGVVSETQEIPCPNDDGTFEYGGVTYKFTDFPGFSFDKNKKTVKFSYAPNSFGVVDGFFSFEENEGYDSDHDFMSDFEEGQARNRSASDPQGSDSPLRRQAMWFNGVDAFLQTPLPEREIPPYQAAASEPRQNFLCYTVECWAKPDGETLKSAGLQTLVERAIAVDLSNPADEKFVQKNFVVGLRGGRWYTRFDPAGTMAEQPVEIGNGPEATTNWTHLAATFDGEALRLYVNGVCCNTKASSLQPEHGLEAAALETTGGMGVGSRNRETISILVGASARTVRGVIFDNEWRNNMLPSARTTLADYTAFYKGYVDEVRIWDGARTAAQLLADYEARTRYTSGMAEDNRISVFAKWSQGARRSPVSDEQLPAQLMYHWSFDHMPGAISASDVVKTPAGFSTDGAETDARAVWSRPEGWTNAWWNSVAVRSTVYDDTAWVPWISDTVAHMPRFDQTTLDSEYWSFDFAGAMSAAFCGYSKFAFQRNHEVYSKWNQMRYTSASPSYTTDARWNVVSGVDTNDTSALVMAYRFARRDREQTGYDLLPMGGAYPKRISAAEGGMWDDGTAADAWEISSGDADNNGLPDWWEDYARQNYCQDIDPDDPLTRDTEVVYGGISMPAWQAYMRDVAAGLVKDGAAVGFKDEYADTRDGDGDGIPDWWERIFSLNPYDASDAQSDPDDDGLSSYQEYVLSALYPKVLDLNGTYGVAPVALDPHLPRSAGARGQMVTDYFLCYSNAHVAVTNSYKAGHFWLDEYFGGIVTDHDCMEDWWENLFPVSYANPRRYDPAADVDGDGWSLWAECRASLWGGYFSADMVDRWTGSTGEQHVPCHPEPILGVKVSYFGVQDISGKPLVVRASTGSRPRVDATFRVPSAVGSQTKYIGPYVADTTMHGHMSPGMLNANAIVFERAAVSSDRTYYWNWDWYDERDYKIWVREIWDTYVLYSDYYPHSGDFNTYRYYYALYPHIQMEGAELTWEVFALTKSSADEKSASVISTDTAADIGTVDCRTGEYSLDMTKVDTEDYVFRVTYTSRIGNEWPQTVYLSDTKELAVGDSTSYLGEGYLREGKNTVEAFIDLDGDGAYTPGEPFGVVQNVDVGWHKTSVASIELKDTSHVISRYDVLAGADDRSVVLGAVVAAGGQEAEDEGDSASSGDDDKKDSAVTKTIVVRRKMINGESTIQGEGGIAKRVPERAVFTKTLVLDDKPYITEADALGRGRYDLDSRWLLRDAAKVGLVASDISTVGYDIEEVLSLADGSTSNRVLASFVNTFNATRGMAAPVAPVDDAPVYSSSPTFRFSSSDETMTACRLQIRKAGAATNVYDSGVVVLPGRMPYTAGTPVHEFTPAIYAGSPVYAGVNVTNDAVSARGEAVYADGEAYEWRVALYNAKFTEEDATAWSAWTLYQSDAGNANRYPHVPTGYGEAGVCVRYYGSCLSGDGAYGARVFVEAFESADFSGSPLSQWSCPASNVTDLVSYADIETTNVVLRGIAPGTVYLRAFIDFNGNGVRDSWESWGYANLVGKGLKAIYNPNGLAVNDTERAIGIAGRTIYIDDTDVDQNEIPDGLEPERFASGAVAGDSDVGVTWEEWADVDLDLDAGYAADGDVMAYSEERMTLVTVWDGSSTASAARYLLAPGAAVPVAGDSAVGLPLVSTYAYGSLFGYGTNVALSAGLVYEKPREVVVALVHSQVYDFYGFSPHVAVPGPDSAYTKPFTAMDKYLVCRWLENTGHAPTNHADTGFENYVMNSGLAELYAKWSLKPDVVDFDHDGMADGWELYVMSGPAGSASAQIGISPWAFADRGGDFDGDGLPNVDEYDGGYLPTDPWNGDSSSDGLGDWAGRFFHFKYGEDDGTGRTGYRGDWDNDQLENLVEYMISTLDGFPELAPGAGLDASEMSTFGAACGQLVPDYFLRQGRLYLGEMFTDHDMVEDWWEDEQGVERFFDGSARRESVSRYIYDAHKDRDGDGWSNWAEARAWIAAGVTTETVVETNLVDGALVVATNTVRHSAYEEGVGHPAPAVPVRVVYNGQRGNLGAGSALVTNTIIIKAWSQENESDIDMSREPDAIWSVLAPNQNGLDFSGTLAPGGQGRFGYLRGGRNMFVAYVTEEDTGVGAPPYRPGMPFGVAVNVNVGYLYGQPFTIEMTDVNPSTVRIDLAAALSRQALYAEEVKNIYETFAGSPEERAAEAARVKKECFDSVADSATDRAYWEEPSAGLFCPYFVGTNVANIASNEVVVRVMRSLVNGGSHPSSGVLLERKIRLAEHPVLTEADLMREMVDTGKWDFDWGGAKSAYMFSAVTSATYRIVVGRGTTSNFDWNNNVVVAFENRFEGGSYQTAATDCEVTFASGQPTFRWKHANALGKRYPAFRLRVWAADGTTLVYDSHEQMAPARDSTGFYSWTAPLWTGMMTPEGKEFKADTDYVWGVSMLDAKFTDPLPVSREGRHALRVSDNTGLLSDYGQIAVAVKYMGPGEIATNAFKRMLRVEAYLMPDFSDSPYAVTYVKDTGSIADHDMVRINALLRGIPKGVEYYVKAYIDSNANGRRDDWESWGYCNYVGDPSRRDVYTPRATAVSASGAGDMQTPDCVIYLEDADTNNNKIPDVWEYDRDGKLGGSSVTGKSEASPYYVTIDEASGAVAAVNLFTTIDPGSVQLPFWSQLTQMANGESIPSASLALAMAGVSVDDIVAEPVATVTSFSLADGITIDVDPRATLDGGKVVPSVVAFNVELTVTVECTDDLTAAAWTEIGSVSKTFAVGAGQTEIPPEDLEAINDEIKARILEHPSAFFRVRASVGGSQP